MTSSAPDTGGRANQNARTRAALLHAAAELVREGRPPSVPPAERALVSVATAYRYFPSADDLWYEASAQAALFCPTVAGVGEDIVAAGDDPLARLEALVRGLGFAMLEDQAPFRRLARGALDQWFAQVELAPEERTPLREGRRNRFVSDVVEPLRGRLPDRDVERIARALTTVVGTDAMIAVTDAAGLDGDDARQAMLDAAR